MIRHIVALDDKLGIAKDGDQPWKLPTDEKFFRDMTQKFGGVVLMGRKTFEVIGRPLPKRQNFILTHDTGYNAEGVSAVHDLDAFLSGHEDVWIIGGAEIYAQTLARADELYITEIEHDYGCDVRFPYYKDAFELVLASEPVQENDVRYRFKLYRPRKPAVKKTTKTL
jgi:dihydrofolate reductase